MARQKTPQQIESQYNKLYMQNYRNGDNFLRGRRITQAALNTRTANGYNSTGLRTRNLDTIFRRRGGILYCSR